MFERVARREFAKDIIRSYQTTVRLESSLAFNPLPNVVAVQKVGALYKKSTLVFAGDSCRPLIIRTAIYHADDFVENMQAALNTSFLHDKANHMDVFEKTQ